MSTPRTCSAGGAPFRPISASFSEAFSRFRSVLASLDAWLETKSRANADREALANMSDRELMDIGIGRASVREIADGRWRRDDAY